MLLWQASPIICIPAGTGRECVSKSLMRRMCLPQEEGEDEQVFLKILSSSLTDFYWKYKPLSPECQFCPLTFRFQSDWLPDKICSLLAMTESDWATQARSDPAHLTVEAQQREGNPQAFLSVLLNGVSDIIRWHFALIIKYQHHWTASRCLAERQAVRHFTHTLLHLFLAHQAPAPILTVNTQPLSPAWPLHCTALEGTGHTIFCMNGTTGALVGVPELYVRVALHAALKHSELHHQARRLHTPDLRNSMLW